MFLVRTIVLFQLCSLAAVAAEKPVVIAHRGGAALRPENTLAAFRHALELGVPILEFDMNLTADDQIVVHHDSTVNSSVCRPVNGSNVKPSAIRTLTLRQIREFDCGSFARPKSPNFQPVAGQRMPTLDEFLVAVKSSNAILLGETKMPPTDAAATVPPAPFVRRIYDSLRKHNIVDRFILQSNDYRTLDAMHAIDPKVRLCVLNARRFKPDYLRVTQEHHATHIMLRWDDATPEQLKQLQSSGLKLYSGTANDPADWPKYVELGFDGILSDDPQAVAKFLQTVR